MDNIPTKNTGDSYTASEFNESNDEIKNLVTDTGQTLTAADDFQMSKAMATNAAGASFYVDSGVADAYVLSKAVTVSLRSPTAYFEGMVIRFRPDAPNTGASTVNVTALGIKSIVKADGLTALSAGDLTPATDAVARFDLTVDAFMLFPGTVIATKTSQGTSFLGDQRITLVNNVAQPNTDIDFSGGRFTFDDGTGQQIVGALTKELDNLFVIGPGAGGRDTGTKDNDSTYHCFAIFNPSTGVADHLFSLSVDSPTLPSGFTKKRRVGAILTGSGPGDILGFVQSGKTFILDVNVFNEGTTATFPTGRETPSMTTPADISTTALLNFSLERTTSGEASSIAIRFTNPDQFDDLPTLGATPTFDILMNIGSTADTRNVPISGEIQVNTDTSNVSGRSQISYRGVTAGTDSYNFDITTRGWVDFSIE